MRVLWLSNKPQTTSDSGGSGSWLDAMAAGLLASGEIALANIAPAKVATVVSRDCGKIRQWVVPIDARLCRNGLPESRVAVGIQRAVEEFRPDLIHVWGTETYWGLLTARGILKYPAVLTLQGIIETMTEHVQGGLRPSERRATFGPAELARTVLRRTSASLFKRWAPFEREIIASHENTCVQTPWQAAQVRKVRPEAQSVQLDLPLREPFWKATWAPTYSPPRVFCSAAYSSKWKGLHTLFRAVALVRRHFPAIELRVAGATGRSGFLADSYQKWLGKESKRLKLGNNIKWLGALSAHGVAQELATASAMAIPTYIESYCMAMAEAQAVGTPVVASFTGGTAHLGRDEETCLFSPPGDEAMLAYQIERLIADEGLAARLCNRSRIIAIERNGLEEIVAKQIALYRYALCGRTVGQLSSPRLVLTRMGLTK